MSEEECNHKWKKVNTNLFKPIAGVDGKLPTHHCNKCGVLGAKEVQDE